MNHDILVQALHDKILLYRRLEYFFSQDKVKMWMEALSKKEQSHVYSLLENPRLLMPYIDGHPKYKVPYTLTELRKLACDYNIPKYTLHSMAQLHSMLSKKGAFDSD